MTAWSSRARCAAMGLTLPILMLTSVNRAMGLQHRQRRRDGPGGRVRRRNRWTRRCSSTRSRLCSPRRGRDAGGRLRQAARRRDRGRGAHQLQPRLPHPRAPQVKEKYRGIDSEAMQIIADILGCHPVEVNAVATFYAFLTPETQGRYIFRLCRTYSCELAGKDRVAKQLQPRPGHRLRRDFGRRQLQPGMGQLHGHVRPGPGHAGERGGLHQADPQQRGQPSCRTTSSRPEAYDVEPPAEQPLLGEDPVECGA